MIRVLLPLSLLANVALAAVFVFKTPPSPATDDVPSAVHAPHAAGSPARVASAGAAAAATDTSSANALESAAAGVLKWEDLPTADFPALVARLRAAGFPPKAIRAVLSALLGRQWVARRMELTANDATRPFWKADAFSRDPKTSAALNQLSRQHQAVLRELLGSDGDEASDESVLWQRRRFGDLPPETLRRVNEIASDYDDLLNQVRSQRVLLAEDRERIAYLEKERQADLAKVLTPAELEEYALRSSNLSSQLRFQTTAFEPTREEFQAIYRAMVAAREKLGQVDNGWIHIGGISSEQQALVLEQLKTALTPARLADFELATAPQHRQTALLVQRLQLPTTVTKDLVAIQTDVTNRANALRQDKALEPAARDAQLAALAQEAATRLGDKLGGSRNLEAYKQNAGQWLQALSTPGGAVRR